jgi:hypothetical protein
LKKIRLIATLAVLAVLVAIAFWARGKVHFDFATFRQQLAHADWRYLVAAILCIYVGYFFRSTRWAWLMRHTKKVPPLSLMGPQIIGFTGVAILGRFADLTRLYLCAKKTGVPVTGQAGVYVVERLFDLGAMAVFISGAVLLLPPGSLPHPDAVERVRHWFLVATTIGVVFVVTVRFAGEMTARFFEHVFGLFSKKLGHSVGQKLRIFHDGMNTVRSFADFGVAAGLSLVMWFTILMAYYETTHAFRADPILRSMSMAGCMVILACSAGASFLQMPVVAWFTQIGILAVFIHGIFGVETEAAWACSTMLLVDTFLCVLPVGLIWAQFEHVDLRKIAVESEHAGEELADIDPLHKEAAK